MPTTYAHYHFGNSCIIKLPDEYQKIINEHRELFDIGVHGPDIFFYNLNKPDIPRFGSKMHHESASLFFEKAKKVYNSHLEKEAMIAYILGFLSHFTFDSTAHGYVERKKEVTKISHNKVESEYDRHLIVSDGRTYNLTDRSESLKPTKESAKIIAYFFDDYNESILLDCLKKQKFIIHYLTCISDFKRNFFTKLLTLLKMEDNADLIIGKSEDPRCLDSNLRLDKLYQKALTLYPVLFNNLIAYFNDKEELIDYFEHDFEQWPDYQDIKVLNAKEELEYKVE